METHHLKGVQLLLDLLCQHGSHAVARGNLAATIVLLAWPSIIEDKAGRKCRVSLDCPLGCAGGALGILAQPESRHKVVFAADSNRSGSAMTLGLVIRRAGGTGVGRVIDSRDARKVQFG